MESLKESALRLLIEAIDAGDDDVSVPQDIVNRVRAALAEPEPQGAEEAWRVTLEGDVARVWDSGKPWPVSIPKSLEAAIRADERTRWAEREKELVEALTVERAKFQSETLQTSTLLKLVQEASRLWADGDHLYMGQRHEFGRQYDEDCPTCWWRQLAADLRTRVTADVLGEARAALGEERTTDAQLSG